MIRHWLNEAFSAVLAVIFSSIVLKLPSKKIIANLEYLNVFKLTLNAQLGIEWRLIQNNSFAIEGIVLWVEASRTISS